MANRDDYMTLEEICKTYHISDSTARRRVVNDIPKYREIGKARIFYLKSDVEPKMAIQSVGDKENV